MFIFNVVFRLYYIILLVVRRNLLVQVRTWLVHLIYTGDVH